MDTFNMQYKVTAVSCLVVRTPNTALTLTELMSLSVSMEPLIRKRMPFTTLRLNKNKQVQK